MLLKPNFHIDLDAFSAHWYNIFSIIKTSKSKKICSTTSGSGFSFVQIPIIIEIQDVEFRESTTIKNSKLSIINISSIEWSQVWGTYMYHRTLTKLLLQHYSKYTSFAFTEFTLIFTITLWKEWPDLLFGVGFLQALWFPPTTIRQMVKGLGD